MHINTAEQIFAVSAYNRLIQQTLTNQIPLSWVTGEITGFTRAASGHWYFSIKDVHAQVRCVMFRGRNQFIDWHPANGEQVDVRATASMFEARGEFQLQVDTLRRAGSGSLFAAFEQLKLNLAQQGLFDAARKRPIPAMPRRVGIITSIHGAVLHDVLTTLRRLMPALPIIIYPCPVQGKGIGEVIAHAIVTANLRAECDTLILCRGGGSMEDLWCFNEEIVARAIAASTLPIISGIGHETDFTIADFVADLRAPTPTAAASLVCTHQEQWRLMLDALQQQLSRATRHQLSALQHRLQWLGARLIHPGERLRNQQSKLNQLTVRLRTGMQHSLQRRQWRLTPLAQRFMTQRPTQHGRTLQQLSHRLILAGRHVLSIHTQQLKQHTDHLHHLNPLNVLARGYTLVTDARGDIVHSSSNFTPGDVIHLRFATGSATARITSSE